jgi:hypothetical protein
VDQRSETETETATVVWHSEGNDHRSRARHGSSHAVSWTESQAVRSTDRFDVLASDSLNDRLDAD